MTILVAGGDSFTVGNELTDHTNGYFSSLTYSALLAKSAGIEYQCCASPGSSNTAISRLTIAHCERLRKQNCNFIVTIMWTFNQRFEFRFNYDTKQRQSPWYTISTWTAERDTTNILKEFVNANECIEISQIKNINTARETGVADFAEVFYKHVGNSEYYEIFTTLKEIVFMQNYLKVNNIRYLFTTADWQQENYLRSQDEYLNNLYSQIDWNNWYFFPGGQGPSQTNYPRGFYQWAIESGYKIGTTHPLEDAHFDAFKLLQEKFNELVKKTL